MGGKTERHVATCPACSARCSCASSSAARSPPGVRSPQKHWHERLTPHIVTDSESWGTSKANGPMGPIRNHTVTQPHPFTLHAMRIHVIQSFSPGRRLLMENKSSPVRPLRMSRHRKSSAPHACCMQQRNWKQPWRQISLLSSHRRHCKQGSQDKALAMSWATIAPRSHAMRKKAAREDRQRTQLVT